MQRIIPLVLLCSAADSFAGEQIHFQSGPEHTALIELYTSEGCSSCPPAEKWFSQLKAHPRLWVDFVPVAFHVDYWDYLGWQDRFSTASYSDRQRRYATQWKSRSVYTPGFVLDGKEWRAWDSHDELPHTSASVAGTLKASSEDGKRWLLRFEPPASESLKSLTFHMVLLGFDLNSDIKAGENRGHKLQHDFVVLTMAEAESSRNGDGFEGMVSLLAPSQIQSQRLGVAAWVTRSGALQPLQAFGGWLPLAQ